MDTPATLLRLGIIGYAVLLVAMTLMPMLGIHSADVDMCS